MSVEVERKRSSESARSEEEKEEENEDEQLTMHLDPQMNLGFRRMRRAVPAEFYVGAVRYGR